MSLNILYLYTEIMGYNLPIFDCLVKKYGAKVDVVYWNENKLTPYQPLAGTHIKFHERSSFTQRGLVEFAKSLKPDLVYISGWQDKGYLPVVATLKEHGATIVMGLDSQWTGSIRQRVGAKLISHVYKKRYYSYAWVPGPLQYEYAKRIGFKNTEIITNLLTGNTELFSQAARALENEKQQRYPKQFMYAGRYAQGKGVDILVLAYRIYKQQYGGTWGLICLGNGPLVDTLREQPEIKVDDFAPQATLAQIAKTVGAFILPSRYEPWGVVVHEFATAGLPLILSENVGARSQFLINGLNGYTFFNNSAEDLAHKMHLMASQSDDELITMGRASIRLASVLTPDVATGSLMSVRQSGQHR